MHTPVIHDIKDKKHLFALLNDSLIGQTQSYIEEGKSLPGRGLLKTQLMEFYSKHSIAEFISAISSVENLTINKSEDDSILVINSQTKDLTDTYYFDISDSRFWTLYSTAQYDTFTKTIKKFEDFSLDRVWLPSQFMQSYIDTKFEFRGYSAKFDNEAIIPNEIDAEHMFKLNLQSSGRSSKIIYDVLSNSPELRDRLSISGIRLKSQLINTDEYVIDDVVFSGKITSIGNSFTSHTQLLVDIQQKYKKIIEEFIEKNCRYSKTADGFISGIPVIIRSENSETDFIKLSSQLFSGTSPFKLWGVSTFTANDFLRINAIDLHTGGLITFDVKQKELLCFLPSDTCGNAIARIFVVIQQHIDSGIKLIIEDEEIISGKSINDR